MDRISSLPDECLVSIISFLPTKVAVSTSVLSKRWECLWMWLPKLGFNITRDSSSEWECERLKCFLHKSLLAASPCLRELEVSYLSYFKNPININILPSSLYTNKSLVILKLYGEILMEDVPHNVCLPSLKTLQLDSLIYEGEESLQRLLSSCPVLEDLDLGLWGSKKMKTFTVIVPSLQRLTLHIPYIDDNVAGVVINTPSLEYFNLYHPNCKRGYYMIENMPKLVEADIDVFFPDLNSFLGSITSVKRLKLRHCLGSLQTEVVYVYGDRFVFNQLEHLNLCVCWHNSNLLNALLKGSRNIRALELFSTHSNCIFCWNEPAMVPECVLSSLQILNWSSYSGSPKERDLAVYILQNAPRLMTATISSLGDKVAKSEMIKELVLSSRASTTCQLIFY